MEMLGVSKKHLKWLKLIEKSIMTGFELTCRDLENMIRYSFFTTQVLPTYPENGNTKA